MDNFENLELSSEVAVIAAIAVETFNDESRIAEAIRELRKLEETMRTTTAFANLYIDLIFFDRGSTDRTKELIRSAAKYDDRVRLIEYPQNSTKKLRREIFYRYFAEYDSYLANLLIEVESLKDYPIENIKSILVQLYRKSDLVIGSKYLSDSKVRGLPLMRRIREKSVSTRLWLKYGFPVSDWLHGIRGWRISVLRRMMPQAISLEDVDFEAELIAKSIMSGCHVFEVPVTFGA